MNNALSKASVVLRRLLIIALIVYAMVKVALPSWKKILVWQLNDNDDLMRILQVRAWLDGQGFYDLINHRLNPPNGGDIHWSRLSDLPLAITQLILRLFTDNAMAEKMAVFAVPLILGGIFAYIAGRTAKVVTNSYIALFLGAFMAVSTPPVMGYFTAGRVDHHGLQLIFMMCGFWGLMAHDKRGAILAGLAIPLSLTIGFELMPVMAIMIAWVAIIWAIRGEENRPQTTTFTIWLIIGTLIGFFINVAPENYLIGTNDKLSIAQLLPIIAGSIGLGLAATFASKANIAIRFSALLLVGILVALVAMQFPVLLKEPYWQIHPLLRRIWLSVIMETFPLTKVDNVVKIAMGLFSTIVSIAALIKLVLTIINRESAKNHRDVDNWSLMASILILTTLMAIFWQARIAGQAAAISIIVASALITSIYKEKNLKWAIAIGLVLNPLIVTIIGNTYNKFKPRAKSQYAVGGGASCLNDNAYSELAKMPRGKIVSHIDFGAHALISTHHTVLAAPYHRNQGNYIAYDILLTPANAALQKLIANDISYVAYCKKSAETGIIERENPKSLMGDLKKNIVPAYLIPIATPKNSDIIAFEVKK